jgi:hypothetical protein
MPAPQDLGQVFGIWDSLADLARDLDVDYYRVTKWSQRGRIPPESFDLLIEAARKKRVSLSHSLLNRLNAPRDTTRSERANG